MSGVKRAEPGAEKAKRTDALGALDEVELTDEQGAAMEKMEKEFERAELALDRRALKVLEPLYEKRRAVYKNIPKFWPTALFNNDDFALHCAHHADRLAMLSLEDLWITRDPVEPRAFTLEFHFGDNQFFSDRVLRKEYKYIPPPDGPAEDKPDADGITEAALSFDFDQHTAPQAIKIQWKNPKESLTSLYPIVPDTGAETEPAEGGSFFHFFENAEDPHEIGQLIAHIWGDATDHFFGRTQNMMDDDDSEDEDDDDENEEEIDWSVLCSTLLLPVPTRILSPLAPSIFYKGYASLAAQIIRSTPSPTTLANKPPISSTSTSSSTTESTSTTKTKKIAKTETADSETKPKRKKKQKEEEAPLELKEDTPEGYMLTAKAALKSTFGLDEFLPGQEDVLKTLFNNANAAAIFPTGSGKSLCFQLPGLVFPGLVVVVTPLISIMKDQVDYLKSIRVSAEAFSGDLKSKKYQECLEKLSKGKYRIILVSPERFSNKEFLAIISAQRISLIAVDEAHCISEWGLSFRPDYLRLSVLVKQLKAERTLVVTATASAKVVNDLKREFDIKPENVVRTGFYRKNLHLRAHLVQKADKQEVLLKCILDPERPRGPTIVYVTYRKEAEDVADWLQNSPDMVGRGISCYHAGMDRSVRSEIQSWFLTSPDGIVVSTIAFGMGVNKRNIRYVYHYNLPGSLEDYAQGIGRAGRDGETAICDILADVGSDVKDLERLIVRDTPSYKVIVGLLTDIYISSEGQADRSFTVNTKSLFGKFFIKETKIATFMAQLEAHGYVTQQPSSYHEKLVTMTDKFTKEGIPEIANFIHEVSLSAQLRELESVQEMLTFLSFNGCQYKHMGKYFGDTFAQDCGHCNYCVTKKVLTVRQLPVLSSKSAFDRYKDSLSLIDTLPSSSSSSSPSDIPVSDDCHCNALGIKWTYNPQEFKGLTGWSFGVAKEYNGRLVYAHFPSLNNFRNLMQVSGANETVYEALLGVTQRPFFAKLMIDPQTSSAEEVKIAFADFLARVTSETLFIDLNLLDITMQKIGTVKTDKGEHDEYLLRAHVDNAVFENAEDFKKFYKLLHNRICWPRNAEEKKWKNLLFIALKDKNNERLHPIYQLQACEPFYLGTPITRQMVKHPQFENELLGFYSNTKQWFNVDELAPVGSAPLGMVFGL